MRSKSRMAVLALVAVFAVGAVSVTPAFASGKPFVETKPATSIAGNEASLNGLVNPNGAETKYYFEYGTSVSYGSKTTEFGAGLGETNINELEVLAGLIVNTKYDFRVVATNSNGTSHGENAEFTTSATSAPSVEARPATKPTETGATVHAVINPNGAETKYYVEYGTTEAYGSKSAEVSAGSGTGYTEISKALTGLTTKTLYYYRIVAKNGHGTVDGGKEILYTAPMAVEPEFKPVPTKNKFTSTSGKVETSDAAGEIVECSKSTTTGQITSVTTIGHAVIRMTGCISTTRLRKEEKGSGCSAKSANGGAGEIITKPMKGELGVVAAKEAASEVGLLLKPESGKWMTVERNECTQELVFSGSVAGEVTPTKKKQTTSKLVLTSNIRKITLDSGLPTGTELDAAGPEVWSFAKTDETTFEEALEVT